MLPRLTSIAAFAIGAALMASTVHWGLKLFVRAPAVPAHASLAAAGLPLAPDWSRLFGVELAPVAVEAAPPPAETRYQLIGIVAPRDTSGSTSVGARGGLAVIAVDGKLPRTYRVGAVIDGQTVLQGVQTRAALLGPRGAAPTMSLQMPALPVAATGTLGTVGAPGAALPAGLPLPPPSPTLQAVPPPTLQRPAMPRGLPRPDREAAAPFSAPEMVNQLPAQVPADSQPRRAPPGRSSSAEIR